MNSLDSKWVRGRVAWAALSLVAALGLSACGGTQAALSCKDKSDCRADNICVSGKCALAECSRYTGCGAGQYCEASKCVAFPEMPVYDAGLGELDAGQPAENCAVAKKLTSGSIQGDTTGAQDDVKNVCGLTLPGPDLIYTVTVDPGSVLRAKVTPGAATAAGQFDPALVLMDKDATQCDPIIPACLEGADGVAANAVESGVYWNTTQAARDVYLLVDSKWSGGEDAGTTAVGKFTLDVSVSMPPVGESCASAESITAASATTDGTTVGYLDDLSGGVDCAGTLGADRVYSVSVPPGKRLIADVKRKGAGDFDPSVAIIRAAKGATPSAACGRQYACQAFGAANDGSKNDRAVWVNTSVEAQLVYVVVDSKVNAASGEFTLATLVETLPVGESCSNAKAVVAGATLTGESTAGYLDDYPYSYDCPNGDGADRVYAVAVPVGKQLVVTATPSTSVSLGVAITDNVLKCGTTCPAADYADPGNPAVASWTNTSTETKSVAVVVDTDPGAAVTFDLKTEVRTVPAGDMCSNAVVIAPGSTLTGETTTTFAADLGFDLASSKLGCQFSSSADKVYKVTVPAGQRGTVAVTSSTVSLGESDLSPLVNLIEGNACTTLPRQCVNSDSAGTVSYTNPSTSSREILAVVGNSLWGHGAYDIQYTATTPAANDACANVTATLTSGSPLLAQSLTGMQKDIGFGPGCQRVAGADRFYKMTVPGRSGALVTLTSNGNFDGALSILRDADACNPAVCTASQDWEYFKPEVLRWFNDTSNPVNVLVGVQSVTATPGGTGYDLSAAFVSAPVGDTCDDAIAVSGPGTLTAQSTANAFVNHSMAGRDVCKTYRGPELVYKYTVPAGKTLSVSATPTANSGNDLLRINILKGNLSSECSASSACLAGAAAAGYDVPVTVNYVNPGSSPQAVYVVVANGDPLKSTFDLTFSVP